MADTVSGASTVRIRDDLHLRADNDEWIVGRRAGGDVIAVPPVGADAIVLLRSGLTVAETHRRLLADQGHDVDVADFVSGLVELGFVAAVDGRELPYPTERSTLPRLRAHHVRWLVTWPVAVTLATLLLAALVTAIAAPALLPRYTDLLWSPRTGLVLAGNAVIAWSVILLHELAHLATARAFGVPGRITLGTRLQFLAAQTDVSGIWCAPRWARLTVYLSGIALNLSVAAAAMLARAVAGPDGGPGQVLGAVVMLSLVLVPYQFLVFMRTDIYFVLQDLTNSRNLYADGSAYVRWWGRRLWSAIRRVPSGTVDPSTPLRASERRAVRLYALLLLVGTTACLTVAATVTLPFTVALVGAAVDGLGRSAVELLDSGLTLAVLLGFWAVWCRVWWRRHGPRVRTWIRAHRGSPVGSSDDRTGR